MSERQRQFGKYTIIDELGSGGFAAVFRAVDTTLNREVALKILHPQLLTDRRFVQNFRQEAQTLAALRHPQIITIYEVGEADGRIFIAMDLVQGLSLATSIIRRNPIPWTETLALLKPLCEALDYAHGRGVVHRDLKPANILLDKQRGALLTDFGFARLMAENTMSVSMSGGIVGTPGYIAPEVWETNAANPPIDIYALGCIVYEMLTGNVLFKGKTPMQAVYTHSQGPQFPAQWPEDIPSGVADVLAKALARNPNERYPSAGALWQALNDLETRALVSPALPLEEKKEASALHIPSNIPGYKMSPLLLLIVGALVFSISVVLVRGGISPGGFAAQGTPTASTIGPDAHTSTSFANTTIIPQTTSFAVPSAAQGPSATLMPSVIAFTPTTVTNDASIGSSWSCSEVSGVSAPIGITETIAVVRPIKTNDDFGNKGEGMLKGSLLAFKNFCKEVPGINLVLREYIDNGTDISAARRAAEAVKNDKITQNIQCLVGHYTSNASEAAKSIYQDLDIPMLSPSSNGPNITDNENKVWRMVGTASDEGKSAADFIAQILFFDQGNKNIFIIYDETRSNIKAMNESFRRRLVEKHQTIRVFEKDISYNSDTDFSAQKNILIDNKQNIDAIFFAGNYTEANNYISQIRNAGIDVPIIGTDGLDSPRIGQGNANLGKLYVVTLALPYDKTDVGGEFARSLGQEAQDIPAYSAESHDAMYLCIQAIKKAKNENKTVMKAMQELGPEILESEQLFGPPYIFYKPKTKDVALCKSQAGPCPGDLMAPAFFVRTFDGEKLSTSYQWKKRSEIWT